MTDSGPRKMGVSIELKPHAYDPAANPELFEGILARRSIAFEVAVEPAGRSIRSCALCHHAGGEGPDCDVAFAIVGILREFQPGLGNSLQLTDPQ